MTLQNGHSYRMHFDNCNCLANRSFQPWKHIAGLILICILMLCNIIHCNIHALGSAQRSIFASDNVSALNKNQGTGGTAAVCHIDAWIIELYRGIVKKMWRCLHIYCSNSLTKPCVIIKINIWLSRTFAFISFCDFTRAHAERFAAHLRKFLSRYELCQFHLETVRS